MHLFIDCETRSSCDLNECGVFRYAEDPSTEVLCVAYAILPSIFKDHSNIGISQEIRNLPIKIWIPSIEPIPSDLNYVLTYIPSYDNFFCPIWTIWAHNIQFEFAILTRVLKIPLLIPEKKGYFKFICTRVLCSMWGIPASLKKAAEFFKLENLKDPKGEALISKLCRNKVPITKVNVTDWEQLYEYCIQDVRVVIELAEIALKYFDIGDEHFERDYLSDLIINDRGFLIDYRSVSVIESKLQDFTKFINTTISILTNGKIKTAKQVVAIKKYCNEVENIPIENLQPNTIKPYLEKSKLLQLRTLGATSSIAKYKKMLDCVNTDSRIRGSLAFYGAHTGRWAGRLVQPQNFPRLKNISESELTERIDYLAYDEQMSASYGQQVSGVLRGMIVAPKDYVLFIADYKAIETKILFEVAKDNITSAKIATGVDLYVDMAAEIYNISPDAVTKQQRQLGKKAILGLGYGMGATKFKSSCEQDGIILTQEFAAKVVQIYRQKYSSITKLWAFLENKFKAAAQDRKNVILEKNGQTISYFQLPEEGANYFICYPNLKINASGQLQYDNSFGIPTPLWGGSITENLVQAYASAIMRSVVSKLTLDYGYEIVLTVHDEIVIELPKKIHLLELEQLVEKLEFVKLFPHRLEVDWVMCDRYCK